LQLLDFLKGKRVILFKIRLLQQKFLDYIQFEKRYSAHTISSYSKDLNQFKEFIFDAFDIKSILEVDHQFVRSWIVSMMEAGISSRSVNRKLSSLKSFYKFSMKHGQIEINPMTKVVAPKMSKRLPEFIEQDKMKRLFDESEFAGDFYSLRDQLILEILYSTGIRLSELIGLLEVNVSKEEFKVLGKRNKERIIPLSSSLSTLIEKYLEEKRLIGNANCKFLLVTDKGDKMYEKFVYRKVNYYLGIVTTSNKKSPHVLRHTFATHMLNNGAELNAIKELLGHANLSATQVYTHNTIEKLKNIHTQAHPRAQINRRKSP